MCSPRSKAATGTSCRAQHVSTSPKGFSKSLERKIQVLHRMFEILTISARRAKLLEMTALVIIALPWEDTYLIRIVREEQIQKTAGFCRTPRY